MLTRLQAIVLSILVYGLLANSLSMGQDASAASSQRLFLQSDHRDQTLASIPRATFLPVEKLDSETRKRSEELLLAALDSEALYTIAGQLKPVSEGFWGTYFPVEYADREEIECVREAVKPWASGGRYVADVLVYEKQ